MVNQMVSFDDFNEHDQFKTRNHHLKKIIYDKKLELNYMQCHIKDLFLILSSDVKYFN